MNRLLFAAARGARIQATLAGQWLTSPLYDALYPYHNVNRRIHPDDEHLQYGPISTAMHEFAKRSNEDFVELGPTVTYIDWSVDLWEDVGQADALHYSLFLLILAEALADEGL